LEDSLYVFVIQWEGGGAGYGGRRERGEVVRIVII